MPHHELIRPEDLEAKAYFGPPDGAKDWLEIGRRRLSYQIDRYIVAIRERSQGRFVFRFPLDTEDAFLMLNGLGYRASRKEFDYCVRHGHIEPPKSEGRRLRWSKANLIDFAMQLERMRYWLPGRHNDKKTVWELQHEAEVARIPYDGDLQGRIDASAPEELLDLIVEADGKHAREIRAHISGYFHIKQWESGRPLDATTWELLRQLIEDDSKPGREAVATTLRRRLEKEDAE
jgi:hypothetical protein